jgi:hypothetical protein
MAFTDFVPILGQAADFGFRQIEYAQQKRDAKKWWDMQNAYNAPAAQMDRFKTAGLNPHLVYGQATAGNASPIQGPKLGESNIGQGVSQTAQMLFERRVQNEQILNLRQQRSVMAQNAILTGLKAATEATNNARGQFDLGLKKSLAETQIAFAKANLDKLTTENALIRPKFNLELSKFGLTSEVAKQGIAESVSRITRNAISNKLTQAQTFKTNADRSKVFQEVKNLQESLKAIEKDNELRELDLKLRRQGINPSDPTWQRLLIQQLEKVGIMNLIDQGMGKLKDAINPFD